MSFLDRSPDNHPHERVSDRGWIARIAARFGVRDLVSLLAVLFAGYAAIAAYDQGEDIQDGRKASAGFTCGVLSAVTKGNRAFIVQQATQSIPKKAIPVLEKLGYPVPTPTEAASLARLAGQAYVSLIRRQVAAQSGEDLAALIQADGSIDCAKQREIARIPR